MSSNTSIGAPNGSQINAGDADYPIFGSNARKWDYRRNQSYLDEDAWREIDDLQVEAAQDELTLVDRLRDQNLIDSVPLETTISMWNEMAGSTEAEVDMDGRSQTVEDLPDGRERDGVPIPLIASAFRLGHRGIEATTDIRDSGVDQSTRAVLEEMERFVARGWNRDVYDGGDANNGPFTVYGVLNHPDRNTETGASWSTDEANIETDVLSMIETLEDDRFEGGSYDLWLNPAQIRPMRQPDPNYDNQRVRETLNDLPEVGQITTSNVIPEGEAVMIDLRREVIDAKLGNGNTTEVAEWDSSPFETRYKVYSAFAPRVKSRPVEGEDARESGIVHVTGIA